MNLGNLLRIARKSQSVEVKELAYKTGIPYKDIYKLETGTLVGTFDAIAKIARVLKIDLNQLARMAIFGEEK